MESSEACHVSFKCKLLKFCFDMMKWEFQRTQLRRKIKEGSWAKGEIISPGMNVWESLDPWREKVMATQSRTLAWKIPWTEEPGRLQSMGSLRVGHD